MFFETSAAHNEDGKIQEVFLRLVERIYEVCGPRAEVTEGSVSERKSVSMIDFGRPAPPKPKCCK